MKRREPVHLPDHDYPVEDWRLVERRFSERYTPRVETLFAVANGYLGLRGNLEEGRPAHEHGTYVAGFHETWPIVHAEEAYGLAKTGQTIVSVPDAKVIKLYVDDEPLFLPTAHCSDYERALDMRNGVLSRSLVWETASGKRVMVRSERLVSLRHRHLAAFSYEVTVLDADAPVVISSQLVNREDSGAPDDRPGEFDPRKRRLGRRVLQNVLKRQNSDRFILGYRAANSGMTLAVGLEHVLDTANECQVTSEVSGDIAKVAYIIEAKAGVPIHLEKFATYHTSRSVPPAELGDRADRVLRRAVAAGYRSLATEQRAELDAFWDRSDVIVEGDPATQQAVRWNLYQLFQASARAEGNDIPAKGLTGSGYEGHYFWDVEIFVAPFLCYTEPRIARNLLRFRHHMLDKARDRAAELNQDGALFPWRTINGEEASAYYQAGTAQYHINADIAYAIKHYVDVTGDTDLLVEIGAEILVETARLWVDLGHYDAKGAFHLHAVTGPDEYTTVVNDNAYTNLMARLNLHYAASVLRDLRETDPHSYRILAADVNLREEEIDAWWDAAEAMHVPYDPERGIHPQDAQFLERKPWDFANTPAQNYPLLLHYHPLVIYRHQVIKQADVILAMFLLGNEFSIEQKARNYRTYDPITTSDSSLSPPVHAIVAAEIGDVETAMSHFKLALRMDLSDIAGNVDHGVHVASTGGVWMALVYGFGGLRDFDGQLTLAPVLPREWERLCFPLQFRGQRLTVDVSRSEVTITLTQGMGLRVLVYGEPVELKVATPVRVPLASAPGRAAAS